MRSTKSTRTCELLPPATRRIIEAAFDEAASRLNKGASAPLYGIARASAYHQRFSPRNRLLLWGQAAHARMVRGANGWKALGRRALPDATDFYAIRPAPYCLLETATRSTAPQRRPLSKALLGTPRAQRDTHRARPGGQLSPARGPFVCSAPTTPSHCLHLPHATVSPFHASDIGGQLSPERETHRAGLDRACRCRLGFRGLAISRATCSPRPRAVGRARGWAAPSIDNARAPGLGAPTRYQPGL